ncbi:TetR/AcrR family transcriptional regulator [Paenibacillus doosanensis]|uniref:HTH-type transcriptional regulator EthR n=1 Tax=Paenibacillus konkukensis TaxID=2020716 RepID=A0ABY4RZ43_9BACL|nr:MULTISPECIES: TetR/AcrR family transcriptional regulator [Paenibacillus]MCS7464317.1 TetR/AcrR family transcriptional regulator [Paenibacillus doosanensis]UQZ87576.1 HTH-type transcriptional regulator EthR [Paenibacillus konkukensis]
MRDKKAQIIQSAIKLFGERDYHTTSIQDIVSLAGVSKGAFYLYFHSKEELLISIYNHFLDLISNGMNQALANPSSTPRQVLEQAIYLQMKIIMGNKEFLSMMQINGAAFIQNETIKDILLQTTLQIMGWYQTRIIAIYGPPIEKHSLDCAVLLNSMMKDYMFYCLSYHVARKPEELASFLYERLDDLVQGMLRKNDGPILSSIDMLRNMGLCGESSTWMLKVERFKQWIDTHIEDQRASDTMLQSLEALIGELKKEDPNEIIIQGMYNYLVTLGKDNAELLRHLEDLFAWRLTKS